MAKLKDFKNEIKVMDIKALIAKAKAIKVDISDLVLDKNMNTLKDLKSIDKKRKELARILTVLGQKALIEKLEPKTEENKAKKTKEKEEKQTAKN